MGVVYLATDLRLEREGGAEADRARVGGRPALPGAIPARVASWRPRSTIPTSCRSTRPARPTGSCGWRCATCRAPTSRRCSSRRGRSSRPARSGWSRRWRARSTQPTRTGSCIVTSSRPTCSSPGRTARSTATSPTSGWRAAPATSRSRPAPTFPARSTTPRRSRAPTSRSTTVPTCTRWVACSTNASPASRRSNARGRSRPCSRTPATHRPPCTQQRPELPEAVDQVIGQSARQGSRGALRHLPRARRRGGREALGLGRPKLHAARLLVWQPRAPRSPRGGRRRPGDPARRRYAEHGGGAGCSATAHARTRSCGSTQRRADVVEAIPLRLHRRCSRRRRWQRLGRERTRKDSGADRSAYERGAG